MLAASIPTKFPIPWANGAGGSFVRAIPTASQIGIQPGYASLTDGFVPLNFTPIAAGGIPPFGQDFNGILKQITQWSQWAQAGGPIKYDGTFAAAISGYPRGAVIGSNLVEGNVFMSIADNNATDPDDPLTSANWVTAPGTAGTGAFKFIPAAAANADSYKWVVANGTTIGSTISGATYAAADAMPLFVYIWNNFSNAQCPVSAGRGANGYADFLANKTITLPNTKGLSPIGMDTMAGSPSTFLSGVPITIGNAITPGSILGESFHTLTAAEIAAHLHAISLLNVPTGSENTLHTHSGSTADTTPPSHDHTDVGPTSVTSSVQAGGGVALTSIWTGATFILTGPNNQSLLHQHAFGTGNQSVFHQHLVNISGNTGSTGGGGSHNTTHRVMTGTFLFKL